MKEEAFLLPVHMEKTTVHNLSFPLLRRYVCEETKHLMFVCATAALNSFVKDEKAKGISILSFLTPDI